MLEKMTSAEMAYWEKRNGREYLGDRRQDYRFASVEARVANMAGKSLLENHFIETTECMPFSFPREPVKEPTQEELAEKIRIVFEPFAIRQS